MKFLLKLSLPIGLLLYAAYRLIDGSVGMSDMAAIPLMIISILLMLTGVFYHGWCLGKHKSPYGKDA